MGRGRRPESWPCRPIFAVARRPDEAAVEAIRFQPHCPFGSEHHLCLVRNIVTNEPQGIHRTALSQDGAAIRRNGKTFRLSLGSLAGGAVKLDADETVTLGLVIGEGLETCLAARQLGLSPVWALGSVVAIERFSVLNGVEGLTILAEAGEPSRKAVQDCFERWRAARRDVIVRKSIIGSDINDAIRGAT